MTPATLGLILAGGLARRLGGGDKSLRPIAGRTVLDRVLDRLRPQVARIILNANGDPARFAGLAVPVIPDNLPDHPGPLAGLLAGLDWAAAHAPDLAWAVTVPADAPFLPPDLVARLHAARRDHELAVASSAGRIHPVVALVPVAARTRLRTALASGLRKVGAFFDGAALADWPSDPIDPFFNVNTPDDLEEAERIATGQ